jgi:hypothetical protein
MPIGGGREEMKTEAEMRQKLKDAQDVAVYMRCAMGEGREREAGQIAQMTVGPVIAILKWALDD